MTLEDKEYVIGLAHNLLDAFDDSDDYELRHIIRDALDDMDSYYLNEYEDNLEL